MLGIVFAVVIISLAVFSKPEPRVRWWEKRGEKS